MNILKSPPKTLKKTNPHNSRSLSFQVVQDAEPDHNLFNCSSLILDKAPTPGAKEPSSD